MAPTRTMILVLVAATLAAAALSAIARGEPSLGSCITGTPESIIVGVASPPAVRYTLVLPSSVVGNSSCILASGGVETVYTLYGPYAYILVPPGAGYATIVSESGCKPAELGDVLLAYMGYGAHSPYTEAPDPGIENTVYVGKPLVIDDEYATITFTPPTLGTAAGLTLEFSRSVDTDTGVTILLRVVPVSRPLKGSYSMLVHMCGALLLNVTVYEDGGATRMRVESGSTTLYEGDAAEERIVVYAHGSTADVQLGSAQTSIALQCSSYTSMNVYLVSRGYTSTGDVTFKVKLVVVEGPAVTQYSVEQGTSIAIAGPTRLQLGESYTYTVSIAGTDATVYIYSPGIGTLGQVQLSDGESGSVTIKATSDLIRSGCLVAVAVNSSGAVVGIAGLHVAIIPAELEKESWVITLTIPYGGGGYVVYSDGEYERLPGQPFTLALAGEGYAGCTITLEVDGKTMYEQQIESTVVDVYIPFNFSTPAKVTVTKTVTTSGCSVDVSVSRLQYYEIIVNPAAPIVTPRRPTHHYAPPSIVAPFIGTLPRETAIIVAAGVAALALGMMRMGNTLSTSLIYASLALLMFAFIIGGDMAYPMLVTLAVLLLGLGIGIKLKMG